MADNNLSTLAYSDNPLERVKSRLESRIQTVEKMRPMNDTDALVLKSRIEAFATAIAEIDLELAAEELIGDHVNEVVRRVEDSFKGVPA